MSEVQAIETFAINAPLLTCIRSMYFFTVASGTADSLDSEPAMPRCNKASAQDLCAHMLPKLNKEILSGEPASAAAAAAPRGVLG